VSPASEVSSTERLVCAAARMMKGRSSVFIGTGIPMLAAALAKRLYAPGLLPIFEFGGVGASLKNLPLGVGESRTFEGSYTAQGITEVMESAQRGLVMDGFLGGAQIDPFGNLNTTVIGDHDRPKVRLPGSGGGNDVGAFCWRTIVLMKHERKRFVEKVDFITTPGYPGGPGGRERVGLPEGTGPYRVVTDLGIFDFPPETRRMRLIALFPGATLEGVRAETGFAVDADDTLETVAPPTEEEIRLLRDEIDRDRNYL
jgi:acyl CoA:acetate/3-ketoacid CoA transferase beta subunit